MGHALSPAGLPLHWTHATTGVAWLEIKAHLPTCGHCQWLGLRPDACFYWVSLSPLCVICVWLYWLIWLINLALWKDTNVCEWPLSRKLSCSHHTQENLFHKRVDMASRKWDTSIWFLKVSKCLRNPFPVQSFFHHTHYKSKTNIQLMATLEIDMFDLYFSENVTGWLLFLHIRPLDVSQWFISNLTIVEKLLEVV